MSTKQTLIHHEAYCDQCEASGHARNVVAWAHNHVRQNPGHNVELQLGYYVKLKEPQS